MFSVSRRPVPNANFSQAEYIKRFFDVLHSPYVSFVFYSDYVSVREGGQRQLAQRCAEVRRDAQAAWLFFNVEPSKLFERKFLQEHVR